MKSYGGLQTDLSKSTQGKYSVSYRWGTCNYIKLLVQVNKSVTYSLGFIIYKFWKCIFDPSGMNLFASMILSLSVSSIKNAINSERQFGQSAALAWLELFHWSMQSEWKIWLQWVWIRSPTADWFLIQGWMQIEQFILANFNTSLEYNFEMKSVFEFWIAGCFYINDAGSYSKINFNIRRLH